MFSRTNTYSLSLRDELFNLFQNGIQLQLLFVFRGFLMGPLNMHSDFETIALNVFGNRCTYKKIWQNRYYNRFYKLKGQSDVLMDYLTLY